METTEKTTTAITDLIIINNDRTQGYKTAAEEAEEVDLKTLFNKLSQQSNDFANELKPFMTDMDKMPEMNETKNTGKLFRVWMDIKAALTSKNRKAILSSCEFGEDKAKETYDDVIKNDGEGLTEEILSVIRTQRAKLQVAHDEVKVLRDSTK